MRNSRRSNTRYAASAAPNRRSAAHIGIAMTQVFTAACVAAMRCSTPMPNLIPAPAGRVSGNHTNLRMSCHAPTPVMACNAWRCSASNAARTSGISSRTARRPSGYASASTRPRLRWIATNGHGKRPSLIMKLAMPVSLSSILSRKRARRRTIAARVSH